MADQEAQTEVKLPSDVSDVPQPSKKPRAKNPRAKSPSQTDGARKTISATAAAPRRYSEEDRLQIQAAVDGDVAAGATLKAAIKNAGVSEQTYYQWKRAAKQKQADEPTLAVVPDGEDFADLVVLEAENQRLRGLLAEKLRAENEALRKRLGMA